MSTQVENKRTKATLEKVAYSSWLKKGYDGRDSNDILIDGMTTALGPKSQWDQKKTIPKWVSMF
jgi:hypothetical protein